MTLQSQTQFTSFDIDFGRYESVKVPPVAVYPPWVNPYHPLPGEEAYAAAWKLLRAKERPERKQRGRADQKPTKKQERSSRIRAEYMAALKEIAPCTVPEIAAHRGVSLPSAGSMMLQLERMGLVYRHRGKNTKGGRAADVWYLEAVE